MRNYFLKLTDYDHYANKTLAKLIIEAGKPEKAVRLMAHLLTAQRVWFDRCNYLPPSVSILWPDGDADNFERTIDDNHKVWIGFLNDLDDSDFEKIISYKNSKGDSFDNKMEDIMAHLINHGTHHRAQIGQELKLTGIENLPITDYIFYIREK